MLNQTRVASVQSTVVKGMVERPLTHEIERSSRASLVSGISTMVRVVVSVKNPNVHHSNGGPPSHQKLQAIDGYQ